ncbi:MAG: type IX secretion system membrane protein PorP/SprF, partial [Ginsengibacter sp.]
GIFQMQNKTSELTVGGALAASLNKDDETPTNVYAGAWFRLHDALIPYIALEFSSMRIGASYDVNVSSLKSGSQSRGGMEVSVIYIKRPPNGRNIPCPKF